MSRSDDHLSDSLAGDGLSSMGVPFGNTLGRAVWRPIRQEWARNTSKALRAAERVSGMEREDLEEWLESDPRAIPLYMKVLWAAGMNGHDKTLSALGLVLGEAARAATRKDDDALEDAELALHAMADMGPRHWAVLSVLGAAVVYRTEDGNPDYSDSKPDNVAQRAGLRLSVANQCLVNLVGAGLAEMVSAWGGLHYPITDLGRAVLVAARESAER